MKIIELNRVYNEDCFETMQKMCINKTSVDLVLTSPPYNTNKKAEQRTLGLMLTEQKSIK